MLELRLEPGQGAGLHVHQNEDEVILVQEGVCTFGNREENWQVAAGGWAVLPKQTAHFFRNTGSSACTLLITALPGSLDRYFAEVAAAVRQQDTQAVAAVNGKYGVTFFSGDISYFGLIPIASNGKQHSCFLMMIRAQEHCCAQGETGVIASNWPYPPP